MHKPPKFEIVADCDEVLVNTNGKWVKRILADDEIVRRLPKHVIENVASCHPMNREEYNITSHFKTHDGSWLTPELKQMMLDKYFLDPEFYDDLNPSMYTAALKGMIGMGVVESLWVLSSCVDLKFPVTASKIRFLDRIFNELKMSTKIHYIFTEAGEKKSEAINKKGINYNSYVEDALYNISDVIENTDSKGREFLIPRYRYNIDFPDAAKHIHEKGCNILWFDNDVLLKEDGKLYDRTHSHHDFSKFPLNWTH
jgi:hypothetical protein